MDVKDLGDALSKVLGGEAGLERLDGVTVSTIRKIL